MPQREGTDGVMENPGMRKKVFVLGDSRTGTTTLHKFLKRAGFNSIHYFFKESGVTEPAHAEYDANWIKLRTFIDEGGYDAFSDYPLRTFYRDLFETYPDALFILTTRRDIGTWRKSMESFFSKFNIALNLDRLSQHYIRINEEIRGLAAAGGNRFIEICIDDDSEANGGKLSDFLGLSQRMGMGWENSSDAYDNALWSSRVSLYNTRSDDFLAYLKGVTAPSKAMLSEFGWVYLINDSSDFMEHAYGQMRWSEAQEQKAVATLTARRDSLQASAAAAYLKFVIPEKSVVYPEYLPKLFAGRAMSESRPARLLERGCEAFLSYPLALLQDVKSYGLLYFRGDSHANWLGAFFLYQHIVARMNAEIGPRELAIRAPFSLRDFDAVLAAYAGDIFTQLDPEMRNIFEGAWRALSLDNTFERLIRYTLGPARRRAERKPVEEEYLSLLGERETFRYAHPDRKLPRAVIFRDSTADYLVEPLAEHFSESLFIWHRGLVYEDVIAREKPDVVLHIMAERFVTQYSQFPVTSRLGLS